MDFCKKRRSKTIFFFNYIKLEKSFTYLFSLMGRQKKKEKKVKLITFKFISSTVFLWENEKHDIYFSNKNLFFQTFYVIIQYDMKSKCRLHNSLFYSIIYSSIDFFHNYMQVLINSNQSCQSHKVSDEKRNTKLFV